MVLVGPALLVDGHHLVVDLVRVQVAHLLQSGRGAEAAVQATAHLARNAGRGACRRGDEHRFDHQAVVQPYGVLDGPVGGLLHGVNPDVVDHEVLLQEIAGLLREVGHALEVMGPLAPEPFIDLVAPEGLHAVLREEVSQLLSGQRSYVGPGAHTVADIKKAPFCRALQLFLKDQHCVPVGIELVALLDRLFVGLFKQVVPGKG